MHVCAFLVERASTILDKIFLLAYRDNGIQLCHRQLLGSLHRRRNLLLVLKQWKWDKREWNEEWRKGEEKRRKKKKKEKS